MKILPEIDKDPGFKEIVIKDNNIWAIAGSWVINKKENSNWKGVAKLPNFDLIDIQFADEKTGFVLGSIDNTGCQVYKTIDAGLSWKKIYEDPVSGNPFDLFVVSEKIILLAINDSYILRSEDGGFAWTPQRIESINTLTSESVRDENNIYGAAKFTISADDKVWVVGGKGSIYYSTTEGLTWNQPEMLPDNINDQTLYSIAFSSQGKGIIIGENNYILATKDFGKHWTEVSDKLIENENKFEKLQNVNFICEKGIIIGSKGLYEVFFN